VIDWSSIKRPEDVPADFERTEYRWQVAPPQPRGLAMAQRLLALPRLGPRFGAYVVGTFRGDRGVSIVPGFRCLYGNIVAGRGVSLCDAFIGDYAPLVLHDDVVFSWQNMVVTSSHDFENDMSMIIAKPIVLERNVWITTRCTILGGVRIGENTVVAAGSVVTSSLPPNVLAGGNPARPIKTIQRKNLR
jgi:acetyltransferase-like isoleucine patch superfamily enzyme